MSIVRKLPLLFVALSTSLIMTQVQAEQEEFWYQIEVLVFSQVTPQAYDSEKWPVNVQPRLPTNSIVLKPVKILPPGTQKNPSEQPALPEPFREFDSEDFEFKSIPKKLAEDKKYEVLIHKSWAQPIFKGQEGTPVLLDDEQSLNAYQAFTPNNVINFDQYLPDDELAEEIPADAAQTTELEQGLVEPEIISADDEIDPDWGFPNMPPSDEVSELSAQLKQLMGPEELRVYGTVTLIMSRFLHLSVDMYFRTLRPKIEVPYGLLAAEFPMEGIEVKEQEPEVKSEFLSSLELEPIDFHLKESERIKTKQIYYYDHPLFGVLAYVTPIDMPEPEELPMAP